jgi:putative transposase
MFMGRRGVSARRACELLGLSRRWLLYESRRTDPDLSALLTELARKYPRFGYRRLHQMLLRKKVKVNVKRVRRLCVVMGLKLPKRRKKKRRGKGLKMPVLAEYPNHVWAYDFVFDWSANGRQLKFLTVEDEFTRECLAIEVDHRMGAREVCQVLLRLMRERGVPEFVRSDNGPEFVARSLTRMLAVKGVVCRHIDPGSPWQNGKNERFNGIFRDECANMETFHHRDHARAVCRLFVRYYNQERPHSSLGWRTPAEFSRRPPMAAAGSVVSGSKAPSPAAAMGGRPVRHAPSV